MSYNLPNYPYLRILQEYSPFAVGAIVAHEERASGSYRSRPFSDEVRYHANYDVANRVSQNVELVTGRFKGETDSALIVINLEQSTDARYLARFQKPVHHSGSLAWDPVIPYSGTYVGLVFRSALPEEDFYPAGKGIVMAPVDVKGVVIEIPDDDLEKLVEKSKWGRFVEFFR